MVDAVMEVRNLTTSFLIPEGRFNAIDDINFSIKSGETLGIVGESGCGKSITALSIMRLIPKYNSKIHGKVLFKGKNLLEISEREMRKIRGKDISMIFQEPMTSLNPLHTVGRQIMEVYRMHQRMGSREARQKAIEMLKVVGIPSPEKRIDEYPHQLSGGMRQRVMIAIALACSPELLIADEPTTALDVTIQAQILGLIQELKKKLNTAIMLITHDLGVVAQVADRIIVMYAGQIVEYSSVREIFSNPLHPYTEGLLKSIPKVDITQEKLKPISGTVPNIFNMPGGCRFAPRCPYCMDVCNQKKPRLIELGERKVRCFRNV